MGIQAMCGLVGIGKTIVVGIFIGSSLVVGVTAHFEDLGDDPFLIRILWQFTNMELRKCIRINLFISYFTRPDLLDHPGVYGIAVRQGRAHVGEDPVVGLFGGHDGNGGHGEGFVDLHVVLVDASIFFFADLDAAVPVILRDLGIAFHDIAVDIGAAEVEFLELAAAGLGFQDAVTDVLVFGRNGAGFEVVVDDIEQAGIVAAVHGAMVPVEDDVVDKIEDAVPANGGVTARVI